MSLAVEGAFVHVMLGFVAFGLLCIGMERARRYFAHSAGGDDGK
jgi:hypothetical protein